jgi:MFS family permease
VGSVIPTTERRTPPTLGPSPKRDEGIWRAYRPHLGLLAVLWIAEATAAFEGSMVYAAQRYINQDFGDPALLGLLYSSYLIIGAGAAALVGRMGDIFGRRRLMIIILAIGTVGSLMGAFSTGSPNLLLGGRILQGLTGAVLPLAVGLVRENMPPDKVPMGIGLMISGASLGTASGLIIGGLIADNYSWNGIFFASTVFCLASLIGVAAVIPKSPRLPNIAGIDWFSGILFTPGIMLLTWYFSTIAKLGLFHQAGLIALAGGSALLGYWVWRSLIAAVPLLDVRLFKNRNVFVANLVTALVALSSLQITLIFAVLLQTPLWTGIGLGATATMAGAAKLPSNILSTFGGPLSGWITGRGGGRAAMLCGGILSTTGWVLAYFIHDSIFNVILVLCVISFGTTILFTVGPTILAQAVPPERTSEVSGMLTVTRGLFSGIGAMMVTSLLATIVVQDPVGKAQYATAEAFKLTVLIVIIFSTLATLCAFALPKRKPL